MEIQPRWVVRDFDVDQCADCDPVVGVVCPSYDGRFPKLTKATYWVASFFPVAGWHTHRMGDGSAVLTPISRSGHWRVRMMWPNNKPRYFGKFLSKREAEKWI